MRTSGAGGVVVTGMDDLRRSLADLDRAIGSGGRPRHKEITEAYKRAAKYLERASRRRARAMGGVHAKAAMGIKGRWESTAARVAVTPTTRAPMALVAFWGAEARTGWYGARKYDRSSGVQHPAWVGANWEPADPNAGPYALNRTVAEELDAVTAEFRAAIDRIAQAAAWRWAGGGWSNF